MENRIKRLIWIIPNVFLYLVVSGLLIWIMKYADELRSINKLSFYVVLLFLLLGVALHGSYRIKQWIKAEKI